MPPPPHRHRRHQRKVVFFYEFNAKRNRIAVEKAIQQKSLAFSPPVSATTTLTTHTHTNTNTNTPETDFISKAHPMRHGHSVSIIKCDAMFVGHTYSFRKEPTPNGTSVRTTTIGISTQLSFIRNFVIQFAHTILRTIR